MVNFIPRINQSNQLRCFVLFFALWLGLGFHDKTVILWAPLFVIVFLVSFLLAYWQQWKAFRTIALAGLLALLLLVVDSELPLPSSFFLKPSAHTIVAKITSVPSSHRYGHHFTVQTQSVDQAPIKLNLEVSLNQKWQTPQLGQIWQLEGKLKPVIGLHNGLDDFQEKKAFIQYQRGSISVGSKAHAELLEDNPGWLDQLRVASIDHFNQMAETMSYQAILASLVLGDKSGISYEVKTLFQRTGTSHLLAISGMHLAAVGGFVWMITGFLLKSCVRSQAVVMKQYQSVIVMIVLSLYVALTGFALPTIRAELMALWLAIIVWLRLKSSAWDALSFAALVILAVSPRQILSVSFQLSFSAVMLLLWIGSVVRDPRKVVQWLKQGLAFSLLSLPINLLLFHAITPISWLANMIAVPVVTLWVLPLSLLGFTVSCLHTLLGKGLLALADEGMHLLMMFLEFLQSLSFSSFDVGYSTLWLPLCLMLVLLSVFASRYLMAAVLSVGVIFLSALWPLNHYVLDEGMFRAHVLDVGQGLAIVIETKDHVMLYDTGPSRGKQGNTGKNVVTPYLLKHGISHLDTLMISHGDDDHQGGFKAIKRHISYDELILGEPDRAPDSVYKPCLRGDHWIWNGVLFEVLHPEKSTQGKNNRSCVLHITNHRHTMLIPGDAEKKIETKLVDEIGDKLVSDILVAGHHGSKTSSSQLWLDRVQPHFFIVSSAFMNQYGFPHPLILSRVLSSHVSNTGNDGRVVFTVGASIEYFYQRQLRQAFWTHYYDTVH